MNKSLYISAFLLFLSCNSQSVVQYFEYPDHNVLEIGSQIKDLYITSDSNTLIAADKGNNSVLFIDVSSEEMQIINSIWVGSEPTSLDISDDGKYLFVGLLGASSVSIVNIENMELEGSLLLEEDSVFDVKYLSEKCQLVVSFLSSNPSYNKTYVHAWWTDTNGLWYGENHECAMSMNSDFEPPEIIENELGLLSTNPPEIDNVQYAGLLTTSIDEIYLFILDKTLAPNRLHRYDIGDDGLTNRINNSQTAGTVSQFHDLLYVENFGVIIALDGTDPIDALSMDHSPVFDIYNLNHISNLDVGSTPKALAYDQVGKHVYISPTDVDDAGMFIVEFNIESQLQTNYYQVAGLLGSHALVIDSNGEYIYAAVDDLSDQDTHEPYNGNSFNIQKIKIIPEGTFPINDY